MQRTAGAQVSASRLSREGPDADVELGFLDEEAASPSMLGEHITCHLLSLWSEFPAHACDKPPSPLTFCRAVL